MLIWELVPNDMSDPRWTASKHKGRAIIRAATEERARQIACEAFHMGREKRVVGELLVGCPWGHHEDMVRCRRLEQSGYPQGRPEEILDPAAYDDEWRG